MSAFHVLDATLKMVTERLALGRATTGDLKHVPHLRMGQS